MPARTRGGRVGQRDSCANKCWMRFPIFLHVARGQKTKGASRNEFDSVKKWKGKTAGKVKTEAPKNINSAAYPVTAEVIQIGVRFQVKTGQTG